MEELKRCPFCGDEFEIVGKGHYYAHKINGCILQHLCFECDDVEAIKLWNTRKPVERILERLEDELKLADANKIKCIKENALMFDTAKGYAQGISVAINILSEEMEHENKRAADCRLDG